MPDREVHHSGLSRPVAWVIALAAAGAVVALSAPNLDGQGCQYDELHPAVTAFAYTGHPVTPDTPAGWCAFDIRGLPVMNMSYTAAIKTGLYGLYLRAGGAGFSVASWRAMGIAFVAAGVLAFCLLAGRGLSLSAMLAFCALLLSDANLPLMARFDWGPVALALALRLALVAVWIRGETAEKTSPVNSLALGVLVALAVFEKLSAIVLLGPLLAMLALSLRRRSARHWLACVAGGLLGGTPLIALNAYTWDRWGKLLSLVHVATAETRACSGFLDYAGQYLALGSGATFRAFILGDSSGAMPLLDGALTALLLVVIGALSVARWRTSPLLRLAGAMALSYVLVGAALYLLPQTTWAHHWVQGMPFQYAAMALAVAGVLTGPAETTRARAVRAALPLAVAVLLLARIPGCAMLERSLVRGDASIDWHPSLNAMARFAARHADQAVFLAADWGVGTQIVCHADGREDVLYEPFWDYRGQADVLDIARRCGRDALYVVWKKPPSPIRTAETERMLRDTETLPGWRRVEVEEEIAGLPAVGVRKFIRAEPRAASRPSP